MGNQPKISESEAYFLVCFALLADAVNWIPLGNFFVTAISLPAFQLYFKMKGVNGAWSFGGNLIEFIPVISAMPAVTAGVVVTIILDRTGLNNAVPGAGGKIIPGNFGAGANNEAIKKAA